jgi:hypothetical protein
MYWGYWKILVKAAPLLLHDDEIGWVKVQEKKNGQRLGKRQGSAFGAVGKVMVCD